MREVDARRKEHGYNEVAEQEEHPVLKFLGKFWGLSAWMLEADHDSVARAAGITPISPL